MDEFDEAYEKAIKKSSYFLSKFHLSNLSFLEMISFGQTTELAAEIMNQLAFIAHGTVSQKFAVGAIIIDGFILIALFPVADRDGMNVIMESRKYEFERIIVGILYFIENNARFLDIAST